MGGRHACRPYEIIGMGGRERRAKDFSPEREGESGEGRDAINFVCTEYCVANMV